MTAHICNFQVHAALMRFHRHNLIVLGVRQALLHKMSIQAASSYLHVQHVHSHLLGLDVPSEQPGEESCSLVAKAYIVISSGSACSENGLQQSVFMYECISKHLHHICLEISLLQPEADMEFLTHEGCFHQSMQLIYACSAASSNIADKTFFLMLFPRFDWKFICGTSWHMSQNLIDRAVNP